MGGPSESDPGRPWRRVAAPRGEQVRLIDPDGGQSGDLVAFSDDGAERPSNGRTFDYDGKIYLLCAAMHQLGLD